MMYAIVGAEEETVDPTPQWVRETLERASSAAGEHGRFVCLVRDDDDQLNALYVDGAWVMEWYRGDWGGHHCGFRSGEAPESLPRQRGFWARLFKGLSPLFGSRISTTEAASMLDLYVGGAQNFANFEWVKRPR
jgi:hypothetical protein